MEDQCNVGDELSDEQKEWFCKFKTLFGEESDQFIAMLKESGCYENKNWKKNINHVVHRWAHKECEDYNWTWKRISKEKKKKVTKTYFAELTVRRLPSNLETLTTLKKISIFHSNISYLPPEIENLKLLEYLFIIQCPLYNLPSGLGNLPQLRVLEVSQCRITDIPDSLYSSKRLEQLILDNNFLNRFYFQRLSDINKDNGGLKKLSLMGNESLEFPPIETTLNIEFLNISETKTRVFSGSNLYNLKTLVFTALPSQIKEPIMIADLPKTIVYLNLSHLIIYESFIKLLLQEFSNLKTIVLRGTFIHNDSNSVITVKEFIESTELKSFINEKFEFYQDTFYSSRLESLDISKKLSSKLKKLDLLSL